MAAEVRMGGAESKRTRRVSATGDGVGVSQGCNPSEMIGNGQTTREMVKADAVPRG